MHWPYGRREDQPAVAAVQRGQRWHRPHNRYVLIAFILFIFQTILGSTVKGPANVLFMILLFLFVFPFAILSADVKMILQVLELS